MEVPVASQGRFCEKHGRHSAFREVHGVSGFGNLDLETEGHRLRAVAEVTFQTPAGRLSGRMDSELFGMGARRGPASRAWPFVHALTVTPIDGEFVDARYTFFVPDRPGER